jgi:uroporphyrinogen decarboxylase
LMERCSEYALAYATALSRAGADLLSGGDSPAGLLGPDSYRDLVQPTERQLIGRIKAATGTPVSLHICGNSTTILPSMKTSGADVLELDHAVKIDEACRLIGPEIALWGNLNPVAVLSQGTPERVTEEAFRVMAAVEACGHSRFVLSSGCTLAVETPHRNIEALVAAARKPGAR